MRDDRASWLQLCIRDTCPQPAPSQGYMLCVEGSAKLTDGSGKARQLMDSAGYVHFIDLLLVRRHRAGLSEGARSTATRWDRAAA